jgi:hypothetical protein
VDPAIYDRRVVDEVAWTRRWWRALVRRYGRRGLIGAVLLGLIATSVYAGVSSFLADRVHEGLDAGVGALTGGPELATPTPAPVGGAPLIATIAHRSIDCADGEGGWLVADEQAAKAAFLAWERDERSAPGPFMGWKVSIVLQGTSATAVMLTGMRAVIDERRPANGLVLEPFAQCGGEVLQRPFAVDITADKAIITALPGGKPIVEGRPVPPGARVETGPQGKYYALPPVDFPFQVTQSDIENFVIDVRQVDNCDCLWHVEIDWASAGKTGTFRVDNRGLPFRSTSAPALMCYRPLRGQPVECMPGSRT